MRRARPLPVLRLVGVVAVLASMILMACSSDKGSPAAGSSRGSSAAPVPARLTAPKPSGPAADLSQEITAAGTPFIGSAAAGDNLNGTGYEEHEFVGAGTATSYKASGPLGGDGRWTFVPDAQAPYRTRVLVRRPTDSSRFNGTVVVEWLNVSGGIDADPDWVTLREELMRSGAVWVGVSTQLIAVEGGPVLVTAPGGEGLAGKGLKGIDPARYGTLSHPGDGFSFDIYTQVARAVRAGGAPLGGLSPKVVIAAGESQSAYALVTYIDGVQPLTKTFDGFFVHSRGATALPLVGPGKSVDLAGAIAGTPVILRTDTDVPIIDIQTETDVGSVLNSYAARQPDTDLFRLWEVAGTSHADAHLLGIAASRLDCGVPINNAPLHIVAKAAFHALDSWVTGGPPPPEAPRLDTAPGATATIERNADGIATGGVRTPPLDVPVDVLSGVPGPTASTLCLLLGSTKPLTPDRIAALYPSRDAYQKQYDASVDATVKAGFALEGDRAALEAFAQPDRVS